MKVLKKENIFARNDPKDLQVRTRTAVLHVLHVVSTLRRRARTLLRLCAGPNYGLVVGSTRSPDPNPNPNPNPNP